MPIDANIALSGQGLKLPDPLAQYANFLAVQNAQRQNQLGNIQARQMEREIEDSNRLRSIVSTVTPQTRNQLLGYGAAGRQVYETIVKGEKETRETQKAEAEIAASRIKQSRDLLPSVTTPEAYANWRAYTLTHLPGLAKVVPDQYSPEVVARLMTDADKALEQHFVAQDTGGATQLVAVPKYGQGDARVVPRSIATKTLAPGQVDPKTERHFVTQNLGGSAQVLAMPKYGDGTANVVTGSSSSMTMAPGEAQRLRNDAIRIGQEGQRIGLEGQRIGLEGRRVAVLEENKRRDADPEFQQRMAAARTTGEAMAKGDVAAIQALPKVLSRAEEGVRLIDELIGKRDSKTGQLIKGEKTHPGFENAVGATWVPGMRFVPGTDAASFMSRFDQIKGASFLEAFESLKGGGSITVTEGEKATTAINRMSIATDEHEFIRAALDLQDVIRKGLANARSRASRAGVTPRTDGAPAAGGGVDTNNPLLR